MLVGQINRGHYLFLERDGRIVGFAGWARATEAAADRWMAGQGDIDPEAAREGDCVILNAWQADDAAAQARMVAAMREMGRDVRLVYGRRSYPGGRTRIVRAAGQPVSGGATIARHRAGRGAAAPDDNNNG